MAGGTPGVGNSALGARYIKIAKVDQDGVDQSSTLQSLTVITIPYTSGDITYNVLDIYEKPNHYVYLVDFEPVGWDDRTDLEYIYTGSLTQTIAGMGEGVINPLNASLTTITDNLGFEQPWINPSTGNEIGDEYRLFTYPQKSINLRASGSITTFQPSDYEISIYKGTTAVATSAFTGPSPHNFNISYNDPSPNVNDIFSVKVKDITVLQTPSFTFTNGSVFIISSSTNLGDNLNIIPEPYFGSNNFAKALDCQPLLNNYVEPRLSDIYQDIDYSTGVMTPTNFTLLISGSALPAEVQDSNYTSLRSIIPRYLGSKNTTTYKNKWTYSPSNEGNYGKTPSIDSKSTLLAYCDWVGGYPPEMMGAYAAHAIYIIKSDGTISTPNVTPYILGDVQHAFTPNENLTISALGGASSDGSLDGFKNIVRGGYRIEPICYNQKSHYLAPPMTFEPSMSLTDVGKPGGVIGDYRAKMTTNDTFSTSTPNTWEHYTNYDNVVSSGSALTSGEVAPNQNTYIINSALITDLNGSVNVKAQSTAFYFSNIGISTAYMRIIKDSGGSITTLAEQAAFPNSFAPGFLNNLNQTSTVNGYTPGNEYTFNLNVNINVDTLVANDIIRVEVITGNPTVIWKNDGTGLFEITQTPSPTSNITAVGLFKKSIWSDKPRVIYVEDQEFLNGYGDPNVKQQNITGSGFNSITKPLKFLPGDQFRFEGDENKVVMIEKTEFSGSYLLITTDKTISGSSQYNTDEFLVRRFVDDASIIIFEESDLGDTNGPYILKPEFLSDKFENDIDNILDDLNNKGYFD